MIIIISCLCYSQVKPLNHNTLSPRTALIGVLILILILILISFQSHTALVLDEIQKSQSTASCTRPSATHALRQRAAIAKHESMLAFLRRRIALKLPNFSNIWHHPLGGRKGRGRLWQNILLAPYTVHFVWKFQRASFNTTRNSSGDEIANVNFLYNDIVHALKIQ